MNRRSGIFTAPFNGVYSFSFSSMAGNSDGNSVNVFIWKNGDEDLINWISETDEGPDIEKTSAHLSTSWMMQLKKGDTVRIADNYSSLFSDDIRPTYFSGQLIMKE